jgi:hypothetical protein
MAQTVYDPPVNTYTPIETITLTSSASSVTFSDISQEFRDLVLVVNGTGSSRAFTGLRFNGDTGTNYSRVLVQNYAYNGNSYESLAGSENYMLLGWQIVYDTDRTTTVTQIMDYSATDKHKTVLFRGNVGGANVGMTAGRWASTSAITSVTFYRTDGTFSIGTTASLYGIKA